MVLQLLYLWDTGFRIKLLILWKIKFCSLKYSANHQLTTWIQGANLSVKWFLMFKITLYPALNKYREYYEYKANGFGDFDLQRRSPWHKIVLVTRWKYFTSYSFWTPSSHPDDLYTLRWGLIDYTSINWVLLFWKRCKYARCEKSCVWPCLFHCLLHFSTKSELYRGGYNISGIFIIDSCQWQINALAVPLLSAKE